MRRKLATFLCWEEFPKKNIKTERAKRVPGINIRYDMMNQFTGKDEDSHKAADTCTLYFNNYLISITTPAFLLLMAVNRLLSMAKEK